jgi:capsular polysaccharide biosynthesis protein
MRKIINVMALVIVIAAAAFGIFMIGAKYCSTETITITSNIEPKNRQIEVEEIEVEEITFENVEIEDRD